MAIYFFEFGGRRPRGVFIIMNSKKYDCVFLYNSQKDIYNQTEKKVKAIFKDYGAEILKENDMGIKNLAWNVKKNKEGYYKNYQLKMDGLKISTMEKEIKLIEELLTFIIVKIEYKKKRKYPQVYIPSQVKRFDNNSESTTSKEIKGPEKEKKKDSENE